MQSWKFMLTDLCGAGVRACHPGPGGGSTRVVQGAEAPRRKHGPAPLLCFLQERAGQVNTLGLAGLKSIVELRSIGGVACPIPGPGAF